MLHLTRKQQSIGVTHIIKEIKNVQSALLSYTSTRKFLRTRENCGEARAEGECSRTSRVFLKISNARGTSFLFLL